MHTLARRRQARLAAETPGTSGQLGCPPTTTMQHQPLADEGDKEDCSCTGTKILFGLGGALGGFVAGWMMNDEMKTKVKARAKQGAANAAQRAADRLRR